MQFKNSLSDYEFYPDRFMKYKLKETQNMNSAIVAETWNNPAQQHMYNFSSEFYHRTINAPSNFIHIDYTDIKQVFTNPEQFNDSHFVILPTEVSLFEGSTYWIPGPIFETTETIILSSVPKLTTSTSLSFLQMEPQVMVVLLLALLSVSLTLTLIQIVRNPTKSRYNSSNSRDIVAFNWLQHLWNSSSIFCSEPYPFIPRIVSARMATVGWLLGVTLFVSVVNCVMKSDFSEEKYQYLDDLETLMENEDIKPVVIEGGFSHWFFKIASKRDKKIRDYLSKFDEDNFCSVVDLMDLGFYEEILRGKKALIINRLLLTWFLGYQLSEDLPEMNNLKAKYGGFYISKQRVKSDFLALLVNKTFSIESPIVYEQECLGNLVMFESAVYHYLDLNSEFALQLMEWMKPMKTTESFKLSAMTGPFIIFICGLSLATTSLIIEATSYAYRLGGRYPYLWLATFFHGLTVESLSYVMPDIDNFWHAQSMVMFLGQRLPLHIVVLYPVFLYTSVVSVSRLRLPNWAEPFAVGLTVVLIDFPFDIIGVKHLWWTWHDTDPNILERNYWVPWVSYYFHASFAAALVIILKLTRKFIIGSTTETSKLKELSCSLLTGILGMPVGVLFFVAFYHPLRDIFSINTEVIVMIYLALFSLIVWTADRNPVIDARTKGKRMFFFDEITLVVVIHYVTILILTYLGKPEHVIREGLHEAVGPCDEIQELHTPLGMILTKRKYLCVTDYDEGYYDFNCVRNQRLQTGQNWYTTCGTPYHNFHEYLLIVGLSSLYSMYYFYIVLYRSGTDPMRSPFKVKRF